jgi:hypothetical protein
MTKFFLVATLCISFGLQAQFSAPAASPRQKVEQEFSMSKISIDYGRPGVKGRKIFGELVPYGKVWRAGANSSTKISFGQSINFNGKVIASGTYGLFVTPFEKEWKIILNKDSQQWGAYEFDEKQNVLETSVPVQKLTEKQEWFEISLDPIDENSVNLIFKWDDVKTVVPLKVGKPETVGKIVVKLKEIKQIEKAAANEK